MFEWPTATPIDLSSYPRRFWYEHFLTFEIPVVYRTIQIDVTDVLAYVKQQNKRFAVTIGMILTRACNHVPELRHRIVDDQLVEYNKVIPSFTLLTDEKIFRLCKGVYTDNFQSDYDENVGIITRASREPDPNVGSPNQGQIFVTNNPWNSFTAIQAPFTRKLASIPVFCVGKMYASGGRTFAPLGIQTHHSVVDGYHIGHLIHILEEHLRDPKLLERPFASTFDV
jgi:chloramphenicol O-acetyltransferase type A